MRRIVLIVGVVLAVAGCGDADTTVTTVTSPVVDSVVAEFETADGETYRILLAGSAANQARAALAAGSQPGIPNGRIQPGDGGVNTGHDWHVVDVEFADMTIELCDATVSYVDDLGYDEFTAQHGDRFCPWGATLVSITEG